MHGDVWALKCFLKLRALSHAQVLEWGSEELERVPTAHNKVLTKGDVLASGCDGWWKMMQPNTQSIKGLNQVSQWYPSTVVQP